MKPGPHITVNQADIRWDVENGTFTYFDIPAAAFWIKPSLMSMLKPMAEEVGYDLFRLQLAASASQGTEEDYHQIVTVLGNTFEEGFLKWGAATAAAGWGHFEMPSFNAAKKRARVRIRNTWELLMQRDLPHRWGCPFIQGKIIGIFTHALGVTCWADEVACSYSADDCYVEFEVYECTTTISEEIDRTRAKRQAEKERLLEAEIQRKTRELDQARIKAESANYAKSRFLGSMSHELRTPLNAVLGFADLLLGNNADNRFTDEQNTMLRHILDAGNNMLSLVNQVLRFSEVSHSNRAVTRQAFSLLPVVSAAIEETTAAALRRSITITNRLENTELPDIIGDSGYLKEILLIILANAVRYIDVSGNIDIEATSSEANVLRLAISDDGPGIEEEKIAGLFEPFERLNQHAGTISGAGVGLPIASMLAKVLGARIGYRNNQPRGSVFWVDLPTKSPGEEY